MTAAFVDIQPLITISGTTNMDISLPSTAWVDVSAFASGDFFVQVDKITSGATLSIQTQATLDDAVDYDLSNCQFTAATSATVVVNRDATSPMMRYLKWRVSGPATPWTATFRVSAVLKQH